MFKYLKSRQLKHRDTNKLENVYLFNVILNRSFTENLLELYWAVVVVFVFCSVVLVCFVFCLFRFEKCL